MIGISKSYRTHSQSSRRRFLSTASWTALGLLTAPFWTRVYCAASQGKEHTKIVKFTRSATTGFVSDDRYLNHTLGDGHPESPERLKAILQRLKKSGLNWRATAA